MAIGDRQRSRVAILRVTPVVPVATVLACRPLFIPALARPVAGAVALFNDAFISTQAISGVDHAAARIALMSLG